MRGAAELVPPVMISPEAAATPATNEAPNNAVLRLMVLLPFTSVVEKYVCRRRGSVPGTSPRRRIELWISAECHLPKDVRKLPLGSPRPVTLSQPVATRSESDGCARPSST
ncbi:hypothetical protein GCM10027572_23730 [Flexivirga lutea]